MRSLGGTSSTYWLWTIESTSVKSRGSRRCPRVVALARDPAAQRQGEDESSAETMTTFFMCRMGRIVVSPPFVN
jgi:hypothetical protein